MYNEICFTLNFIFIFKRSQFGNKAEWFHFGYISLALLAMLNNLNEFSKIQLLDNVVSYTCQVQNRIDQSKDQNTFQL
jgi:hypothetical protein